MVTHHSAVVSWKAIPEKDSNGGILGYNVIFTSDYNETVESNITARASDTAFSYVVQNLSPNTTYRFRIYGYNINGDSPQSEFFYFTTKGEPFVHFSS